jgi:hypothetical protein
VEDEVQLEGSFPALRRLTIELPDHGINKQFNDCDWEPDTETLADFEDAPLLGEVKLIGWYDRMEILLPWSKLTTISLEYNTAKLPPVPRGTTWIFVLCPLLKCTMNHVIWDDHMCIGTAKAAVAHSIPRLQELYLYSEMAELWRYLDFPNLKHFRLPCHTDDIDSYDPSYALTFTPRIDYLCLSIENHFSSQEALDLLRSAPSVMRELKIEYTTAKDFLIDPVLEALRDDATLVSHLTTLDLHSNNDVRAIPYELLADMLTRRSKATQCVPLLHSRSSWTWTPTRLPKPSSWRLPRRGWKLLWRIIINIDGLFMRNAVRTKESRLS